MKLGGGLFCALVALTWGAPGHPDSQDDGVSLIVGGSDADPGEVPYIVSFQRTDFSPPFHFCGGSIYDENYVVTAAHCVYRRYNYNNPKTLQVVAGDWNVFLDDGTEQIRRVVKIILHKNYNPRNNENDIALLKVDTPFEFTNTPKPVVLPTQGQNLTGNCVVSGWGRTLRPDADTPDILQKVSVPIVSDADCRTSYSNEYIADSMICAGFAQGGKDSCQGDSGGPMVCDGFLTGIVSWGYSCAQPNYPGVYTEVPYYVNWLRKNAV